MNKLIDGAELVGQIISFDEHIGLGEIKFESDDVRESIIPFHCTNIGDGSRMIDLDTTVRFVVYMHPMGRLEAKEIVPI